MTATRKAEVRAWVRTVVVATLAGVAAAQTDGLRLEPCGAFDVVGGRVLAVDIDHAGTRLATVGEFGDAVAWHVDGRVLGRAPLADSEYVRYLALHPVRAHIAYCVDRSQRSGPYAWELGFERLDTGAAASVAVAVRPLLRLEGAVLGMAWSVDGSCLAVGRAGRGGSWVDVFTPVRGTLQRLESMSVESLIDLVAAPAAPNPRLAAFVGCWRSHRSELLPGFDEHAGADPAPRSDGLLVADAQARFARFVAGVGIGVDRLGQTFVRIGQQMQVHACNRGPVLGLMFTPDGSFVAAASRGAVTIAAPDGGCLRVVPGKHLLAAGDSGAEILLLGARVRRYDVARSAFTDAGALPAADTGTGEDDARLYARPQLRTALRLPDGKYVIGGYSQFGHEGLVVDVAGKRTQQVADTERESDDRLVVDVGETALLAGARWTSREYLRAGKGAFRRTSVLRVFDGEVPKWAREFTGILTALAASPDGDRIVVAEQSGAMTTISGATGEPGATRTLSRPPRWLAFLDDATLLMHDGVELVALGSTELNPVARVPLPAGAPIGATALDPERRRIAFGRGARVWVYVVGR